MAHYAPTNVEIVQAVDAYCSECTDRRDSETREHLIDMITNIVDPARIPIHNSVMTRAELARLWQAYPSTLIDSCIKIMTKNHFMVYVRTDPHGNEFMCPSRSTSRKDTLPDPMLNWPHRSGVAVFTLPVKPSANLIRQMARRLVLDFHFCSNPSTYRLYAEGCSCDIYNTYFELSLDQLKDGILEVRFQQFKWDPNVSELVPARAGEICEEIIKTVFQVTGFYPSAYLKCTVCSNPIPFNSLISKQPLVCSTCVAPSENERSKSPVAYVSYHSDSEEQVTQLTKCLESRGYVVHKTDNTITDTKEMFMRVNEEVEQAILVFTIWTPKYAQLVFEGNVNCEANFLCNVALKSYPKKMCILINGSVYGIFLFKDVKFYNLDEAIESFNQ